MKKKSVFTKKAKDTYKKISVNMRIPLQFRSDLYYVGWSEDDVKYLKSAAKKISKL